MRRILLTVAGLVGFALPISAQNADEIVARYMKAIGGMDRIQAIRTLRRTGKLTSVGSGFEIKLVQENKRPNLVRQDVTISAMTGVVAFDGSNGWKIEPWEGKKDAESLGEEEMKQIVEESDFDGPLVHYRDKGNKVEFVGTESVEGTDTYRLKVTLANGDLRYYLLDTDSCMPIKIEIKRMIRGAEREYESWPGDYQEVSGVYLPYSIESNERGSAYKQQTTFQKIEANIPLDDSRFRKPALVPSTERPGAPGQ